MDQSVANGSSGIQLCLDQVIKQSQVSAFRLFGHPRDLDVQNLGRRDSSATSGGLPALQFVQRPVESPLYSGLVPGELRERVGPVGVPAEGPPECGSLVLLLAPHSAGSFESLFMPLFIGYG